MAMSTVTSKGQITIPKEIREHLRLRAGHRVEFFVDSSGQVVLKPHNQDFRTLKGILYSRRRRPVSIEQINEVIARGWAGL